MLRQMLSSLFVMLAFSVMLVHEVIPHHHHADHICLQQISCHTDHGHEPEPADPHEESCALQDMPVVTTGNHGQEFSARLLQSNQHPDADPLAFLSDSFFNILLLTPLPFRQTPLKEIPASVFAGSACHLRAPPVI